MTAVAQKTQAELVALVQDSLKSDAVSSARLVEWLDIWLRRIAEHRAWDALYHEAPVSTVDGQTTCPLPDGTGADPRVHKLFRVFLDDSSRGKPLKYEGPTLFDERHRVEILLGTVKTVPGYYTVRNMTMEIYPIPDGVYSLRACYNRPPESMAAAASVCEIQGIDDALYYFLLGSALAELGEDVKAAQKEQMGWARLGDTHDGVVEGPSAVQPYIAGG